MVHISSSASEWREEMCTSTQIPLTIEVYLKVYSSCFFVIIIQTNTLAGFEFSLFTKHILPNVVHGVLMKASSLVHVTFDRIDAKSSGRDLLKFAKFMFLRNSEIKVKIEIEISEA